MFFVAMVVMMHKVQECSEALSQFQASTSTRVIAARTAYTLQGPSRELDCSEKECHQVW